MSTLPTAIRLRSVSPSVSRLANPTDHVDTRSARRRLGLIWGLLFFNVIGYQKVPSLLPINGTIAKLLTEGALGLALLVALSLNRRVVLRPNLFLGLFTILCVTTLMLSVDQYFGLGSSVRGVRLIAFVLVLWLTTPWWGRSDYLLCRIHWKAIMVVLSTVVLGLLISPGRAFAQAGGGRLGGDIWPIPPTQVAHYAAIVTGLTVMLWFSRMVSARSAVVVIVGSSAVLVLTHTRTALVGLLVGVLVGGLSLYATRKRVRRAFTITIVIVAVGALTFAPFFTHWFSRGQSPQEIAELTGRSIVWSELLAAPRSEVHVLFGYGMSNDSFNGLSIDSSWLSTYQDQGIVGDIIIGSSLVLLLILALLSPRGPARAITLFLVVYCAIASYTETGLGDASTYLMDLSVAMSVLMSPLFSAGLPAED